MCSHKYFMWWLWTLALQILLLSTVETNKLSLSLPLPRSLLLLSLFSNKADNGNVRPPVQSPEWIGDQNDRNIASYDCQLHGRNDFRHQVGPV